MTHVRPDVTIVAGSCGSRDALLLHALDLGAVVAIWADPKGGWIEAYARPRDGRFRWRAVVWPDAPPLVLEASRPGPAVRGPARPAEAARRRSRSRRPR